MIIRHLFETVAAAAAVPTVDVKRSFGISLKLLLLLLLFCDLFFSRGAGSNYPFFILP